MSEIIRKHKGKEHPFAQIPNEMLRNKELSWQARGLLAYILSCADGWNVVVTDLIKQSPAGRDATRSVLKELEKAMYIQRRKYRTPGGRFAWESIVYEDWRDNPKAKADQQAQIPAVEPAATPSADEENCVILPSPSTENPSVVESQQNCVILPPPTENPSTAHASTVRPAIKNTDIKNTKKRTLKNTSAHSVPRISATSGGQSGEQISEHEHIESVSLAESVPPATSQDAAEESQVPQSHLASDAQFQKAEEKTSSAEPKAGTHPLTPYKEAIRLAVYGDIAVSNWSVINKQASQLKNAGLSVDDVYRLVAWIKREVYPYSKGTQLKAHALFGQVDPWRAATAPKAPKDASEAKQQRGSIINPEDFKHDW